jgi:hypothetical protein
MKSYSLTPLLSIEHWSLAIEPSSGRAYTTLPIRAARHQSRFEGSFGVIGRRSPMTNDHVSILNSQFTRKNRRLNPWLQSPPNRREPNLNCGQKCTTVRLTPFPFPLSSEHKHGNIGGRWSITGARSVDKVSFWSAPAERRVPTSRDFVRPGHPRTPDAARAKAVSRSACHRTPQCAWPRRIDRLCPWPRP